MPYNRPESFPERVHRLEAEKADLLAALKAVEWVYFNASAAMWCPSCLSPKCDGHFGACQLAAAIAKAEGRE